MKQGFNMKDTVLACTLDSRSVIYSLPYLVKIHVRLCSAPSSEASPTFGHLGYANFKSSSLLNSYKKFIVFTFYERRNILHSMTWLRHWP